MFGSRTRDRHALGQSAHGDLPSAASIRVVTGGSRLGLFSRLLDELVQLCQAAFAAVSKGLQFAVDRVRSG